jgi:hypothetical protein
MGNFQRNYCIEMLRAGTRGLLSVPGSPLNHEVVELMLQMAGDYMRLSEPTDPELRQCLRGCSPELIQAALKNLAYEFDTWDIRRRDCAESVVYAATKYALQQGMAPCDLPGFILLLDVCSLFDQGLEFQNWDIMDLSDRLGYLSSSHWILKAPLAP